MQSKNRLLLAVVPVLLSPAFCRAADKLPAYTDPAQADADFAFQGEYTGAVDIGAGKINVGVQIVALGEGKFQGGFYYGGLPGAGWDRQTKYEGTGELADGVVTFKHLLGAGKVKDGVLHLLDDSDEEVGTIKRTERISPTPGAKPPEGAVVLFDGSSADQFAGGRMTEDGLLMAGAKSKQLFGDCKLHLEFQTPYMPTARGQVRGNSGCYLQGRYEVQVLDSFGLAGKSNECGGVYETSEPAVNMCYPPLAWQTYDIDYKTAQYDESGKKTADAVLTVRHNGELVQNKVKVPKATRAAPVKEGPEPGPLYLQDHGNPVRYRNIWLVEVK